MASDDWYTPKYIFDALNVTFTLDVAAPLEGPRYVPAYHWYAAEGEHLEWDGLVWMNPPYGHQRQKHVWLDRFAKHGNGIALMPDRTSAPWFQHFAPQMDAILWINGKVKFEKPNGEVGNSPGNGSVLFAMGPVAVRAVRNSCLGFVTVALGTESGKGG